MKDSRDNGYEFDIDFHDLKITVHGYYNCGQKGSNDIEPISPSFYVDKVTGWNEEMNGKLDYIELQELILKRKF